MGKALIATQNRNEIYGITNRELFHCFFVYLLYDFLDMRAFYEKEKNYCSHTCAVIILLFPVKTQLKDGGTVQYRALLYNISKVHSVTSIEEQENGIELNEGLIIEILGFEIYNNVKRRII